MVTATTPAERITALTDQLRQELIVFWRDDAQDVLTLPPDALRRLAADYLMHRGVYRGAGKRLPENGSS